MRLKMLASLFLHIFFDVMTDGCREYEQVSRHHSVCVCVCVCVRRVFSQGCFGQKVGCQHQHTQRRPRHAVMVDTITSRWWTVCVCVCVRELELERGSEGYHFMEGVTWFVCVLLKGKETRRQVWIRKSNRVTTCTSIVRLHVSEKSHNSHADETFSKVFYLKVQESHYPKDSVAFCSTDSSRQPA